MSAASKLATAEISCWCEWIKSVMTARPGIHCIAGGVGSGKQSALRLTRACIESEGLRVVDAVGIVKIDDLLQGTFVLYGEVRAVADLQRVVDLADAGAIVLCSIHARDVRNAMWKILQSNVLGGSIEVVGPLLRAVMAQIILAKMPNGLTCLNEFAVFETAAELQFALANGPHHSFQNDADSKITAGIVTIESATQAGAYTP